MTAEHELSPMTINVDKATQETRLQELRNLFAQYAEAKLRNARELVAAANKIELIAIDVLRSNSCASKY